MPSRQTAKRGFENGFLNHGCRFLEFEFVFGSTETGSGNMTAGAIYYYRIIPVGIDGAGNIHRGIPSPLIAQGTGSNKQMACIFPNISLTDRQPLTGTSSTIAKYPLFYELYRSAPTPGSRKRHRRRHQLRRHHPKYLSGDDRRISLTYTDNILDTTVANNALCYTFGGALPNGCPPGGLDIVAHQGRAWVLSDDGQNWYFSKQIVDGEAVNFTWTRSRSRWMISMASAARRWTTS